MNDDDVAGLPPVKIFVGSDQVVVDGSAACVGLSLASAEQFSRGFLAALGGESGDDAG